MILAGHPITIASDYKDSKGNKYIIKVKTMKTYLTDKYGAPTKITSKVNKKGIILYEISSYSDATGHVCLYKNGQFKNAAKDDCFD